MSSVGFYMIGIPSKDLPISDWEDQVEEQIKGRQNMSLDHGARKSCSAGSLCRTRDEDDVSGECQEAR